jgi:hypothetical protein
MKIIKFAFLFLIATLVFYGCYMSEVPLSESPLLIVDTKLLGTWISIPDANQGKRITLLVHKFNENEYLLVWREGDDGETCMARGFNTRINNTNIINVQGDESPDFKKKEYLFFKYDFNEKGNLVINILSAAYPGLNGKVFKSSKDFNDFIQENISQKGLFDKSIEFETTKDISFVGSFKINPK